MSDNTLENIDFTNENNPEWGNYPPNDLDVAKWHYFEGVKGGFNPKPLQLCWVRLFETHGNYILEESYHLGLYVEVFREEYDRDHSSEKFIKSYEIKSTRFIDHDGYIIGDGSGTEEYQWKPCISEFQNWGDAVKWKAIRNYNKTRIEWEKHQRGGYHLVKERCISKIKLKGVYQMPMIELLNMLYELRLDVEKQITFHGYKEDYMKRIDKMIQIVKPYADQENNNERHSEELFDELD